MKYKRLKKIILVSLLMFLFVLSSLSARVVASDIIIIRGYIPARTNIVVNQAGEMFFTSNEPNALLNIMQGQESTLLSIIAL